MLPPTHRLALFALSTGILFGLLSGCGGGGSGGGTTGFEAARVSLAVDRNNIDTGDLMGVRVFLSDVRPEGVLLKLRYPEGLRYRRASSELETDGDVVDIDPFTERRKNELAYLVYILPREAFGDSGSGIVRFTLDAVERADGTLAVDPDFNDPNLTSSQKFDVDSPQFDAEDEEPVTVSDGTPSGTPTPTPTPRS